MPLNIAILGSGIFVQEQHLPAILLNREAFNLRAIYSRSQKSIATLIKSAQSLSGSEVLQSVLQYSDDSSTTLDHLLKSDEVEAVVIALPILVQGDVIKKCLAAGKHVLAEKPLSYDVGTGKALLDWYRHNNNQGTVFAIAENFRFEEKFLKAAELVREGAIGRVVTCHYKLLANIPESDKYYNTEWRKKPEYQGGFVLDGGVHFVASIRAVLGDELKSVTAHTACVKEFLKPVDTVNALFLMKSGATVSFNLSFASSYQQNEFIVSGTKGWLSIAIDGKTNSLKVNEMGKERVVPLEWLENFEGRSTGIQEGVYQELQAFADRVLKKSDQPGLNPENALSDLGVIEAILESGKNGGTPVYL